MIPSPSQEITSSGNPVWSHVIFFLSHHAFICIDFERFAASTAFDHLWQQVWRRQKPCRLQVSRFHVRVFTEPDNLSAMIGRFFINSNTILENRALFHLYIIHLKEMKKVIFNAPKQGDTVSCISYILFFINILSSKLFLRPTFQVSLGRI